MPLDHKVTASGIKPVTEDDSDPNLATEAGDKPEQARVRKLVSQFKRDNQQRSPWREKQAALYRMRTVGLGRASLPFRGASDFHYPLGDTLIEKLKPFYYQQALQPDPLCSFIPKTSDARAMSSIAAHWFDYQVRTKSNFRQQLPVYIDLFLERSKSILKITWDKKHDCLKYEAIDPVNIIVPPYTEWLENADRICHIMYISKAEYLRMAKERGWNTDEAWLKRAMGQSSEEPEIEKDKLWVTGIEQTATKNELLTLWEMYSLDEDGDIIIDLASPYAPDQPVRDAITVFPYDHGQFPFVDANYEIKSRSYYDNRGVIQICGQFELELCKMENEKLDYMTFCNRPVFTHEGSSFNVQNLKIAPGQIIGNNLKAVEMPKPPIDFTEEAQYIRSIAEERIGVPDLGLGRSNDFRQPRTAKEAEILQQVNNQGVDMRARVFHYALSRIYSQSWSLCVQFARKQLEYAYHQEYDKMDPKALANIYVVEPNGNADGYDVQTEINRLMTISQIPAVMARVDPDKFARMVLELMNARYIHDMFMPGGVSINQYEKQADEIGNMLNGFPIQVQADDKHGDHLRALVAYFMFSEKAKMQVPLLPTVFMYKHFLDHYQAYAETDSEGFKKDKQALDQNKGMIERSMPLLMQALQDGMPPMGPLDQVMQHIQTLQQQINPPPLGPMQGQGPPQVPYGPSVHGQAKRNQGPGGTPGVQHAAGGMPPAGPATLPK